jgi:hypothetical protein
MVEGYVGRSWAVWTGARGFADELRIDGVLGSSWLQAGGEIEVVNFTTLVMIAPPVLRPYPRLDGTGE